MGVCGMLLACEFEDGFNRLNLLAPGIPELDAVIFLRIMRCGDDEGCWCFKVLNCKINSWCWAYANINNIKAHGTKSANNVLVNGC